MLLASRSERLCPVRIEMTLATLLLWLGAAGMLSCFLGVLMVGVFWLVTVRRLTNHPTTQGRLGMPIWPAWELRSVASAITLPRAYARWLRKGAAGALCADVDAIYQNTSLAERILGRAGYGSLLAGGAILLVWYALDRLTGVRLGP